MSTVSITERRAVFGFPDIWDEVYTAYEDDFRAIDALLETANKVIAAAPQSQEDVQELLRVFTKINSEAMRDVLILAGNKRGTGAMKIVRTMFETSITAEYLEKNPAEVQDYFDFAHVGTRRSAQGVAPGKLTSEQMKEVEANYEGVKGRFTNSKGRIRNSWSAKTLKEMANELNRTALYELIYGASSDLSHVNVMGVIAHELDWTKESLRTAHGCLLQTVCSLFNVSRIEDLRGRINSSIADFERVRGLK